MRTIGTRNLVDAAQAAGVRRMVAQSISWAYAPGAEPATEDVPLDLDGGPTGGARSRAARAWRARSPSCLSGSFCATGRCTGRAPGTSATA
ncbi:hypothetical protein [Kribbella sp. DT2]|uniref:hypothetical protein n=1 Tax=Kribbella sp. DT2 TaxID=3393427 RepID=UPI003CED5266